MAASIQTAASAAGSWQQQLRDAVRDPAELAELLELPAAARRRVAGLPAQFPLLVPRAFVARMRKRDPDDPLLRQVLPLPCERDEVPGFTADPLRELGLAQAGFLQKYRGRALLIASAACPVHCRYCFRREFPYSAQLAARADFAAALDALRASRVSEVILSGGDPLSLSNRRLGRLLAALESIESLRAVRLHTRFPVVLPDRVDAGLVTLLERSRLASVVVVHANHPNELAADATAALEALAAGARFVLNQSVLLRGVNDSAGTLAELSERLFACRVLPYYLHLLDPVAGTAHFAVTAATGRSLVAALRARLPGYLVPRLVREIPGELSKTPMG